MHCCCLRVVWPQQSAPRRLPTWRRTAPMLCLGEGYDKTCRGLTRRHIFELGGSAALGLSLAEALPALASPSSDAKAQNVILFWLSGGHSQHETFDPKPDQPIEVR